MPPRDRERGDAACAICGQPLRLENEISFPQSFPHPQRAPGGGAQGEPAVGRGQPAWVKRSGGNEAKWECSRLATDSLPMEWAEGRVSLGCGRALRIGQRGRFGTHRHHAQDLLNLRHLPLYAIRISRGGE